MDRITSEQAGPALQLNRPLLPIDEYAARQGLSRRAVEEYGWMGIVQIRKHRGKTFVVDVPLNPYSHISEILDELSVTDAPGIRQRKPLGPIQTARPKKVEPLETEKVLPPEQTLQDDVFWSDAPQIRPGSRRRWKIAFFLSLAFLCLALLSGHRLSVSRKAQQHQLNLAYSGVQTAYSELTSAKQHTEIVQKELADARAKLERLQNELDGSKVQLKNARDELAQAGQNFEITKQRYVKAIDQLNGKIQELSARLAELTSTP